MKAAISSRADRDTTNISPLNMVVTSSAPLTFSNGRIALNSLLRRDHDREANNTRIDHREEEQPAQRDNSVDEDENVHQESDDADDDDESDGKEGDKDQESADYVDSNDQDPDSMDILSKDVDSRQSTSNQLKPRPKSQESAEPLFLEQLEEFAGFFKQKRIQLGFTQGDVGLAMGRLYGNDFSQTTVSRFEALNLSFKNMCKLKPLLEKWLNDAEKAVESGTFNREILRSQAPVETSEETLIVRLKKRRKRTSIESNLRQLLEEVFARNPRPSAETMSELANTLEMDKEVIRVWFCNRRQKARRQNPDIEFAEEQVESVDRLKGITVTPTVTVTVTPQLSQQRTILMMPLQQPSSSTQVVLPILPRILPTPAQPVATVSSTVGTGRLRLVTTAKFQKLSPVLSSAPTTSVLRLPSNSITPVSQANDGPNKKSVNEVLLRLGRRSRLLWKGAEALQSSTQVTMVGTNRLPAGITVTSAMTGVDDRKKNVIVERLDDNNGRLEKNNAEFLDEDIPLEHETVIGDCEQLCGAKNGSINDLYHFTNESSDTNANGKVGQLT